MFCCCFVSFSSVCLFVHNLTYIHFFSTVVVALSLSTAISYGPSGVCLWAVKGVIHVIWGDEHRNANMVPVDYCINAMVCAAWDVNRRYKEALDSGSYEVPLYNYLYSDNNLTWGKYMKNVRRGLHQPLEKSLW